MLSISGTIPVLIKGVEYNIPISLWLHPSYPDRYPLVYVTPTSEMVIHPRHNSVDEHGMVFLPYLNEWTKGQSDLKTLVQKMCTELAVNCPISARQVHQQQLPMAYTPPGPNLARPHYPRPDLPQPHYQSSFPPPLLQPRFNIPEHMQIGQLRDELTAEKLKCAQLREQNAKLKLSMSTKGKLTRQLTEEQDEKIHQLRSEVETNDKLQMDLVRERDTAVSQQKQLETQIEHIKSETKQLEVQRDSAVYQQQQLQNQLQQAESEKKQLEAQRDLAVQEQHRLQAQLQHKVYEQQQNEYSAKEKDKKSRFTQMQVPSQNVDSWNVYREEVKIFDKIGRGAWGVVSRGEFRNQTVAVKQAFQDDLFDVRQMQREVQIMANLQHPNIVRFVAAVIDDQVYREQDTPLLVMELLDMNLREAYIRGTDLEVLSIFQDVAYALHYLHDHKDSIFHRDVSAPNVLLKSLPGGSFQAKLSDLGSANKVKHAKTATTGAICYIAPESLPPKNPLTPMPEQTTKIDVFSYGILLTEVITKTLPTLENRTQLFVKVKKQWKVMYDLISECIQENPIDRPTMSTILSKLHRISTS